MKLPFDLRTGALALAAVFVAGALFSPGWTVQRGVVEQLIVIDVTQSMNVADMSVAGARATRLDAAKAMLAAAIGTLPCGSKVGLSLFTEYRALVLLAPVEVCRNRSELLATLAQLDGRMAWTGSSEIAKGLNSSLRAARELGSLPAVVFVSDGHEAPPLDPGYRPAFDDEDERTRASVRGLIVGVGGDTPLPIPKSDPDGTPRGNWRAEEVMQISPRNLGRGGSVAGEAMADGPDRGSGMSPLTPLGTTPGTEHLSALRDAYLRQLASETRLHYHRLASPAALRASLMVPTLRRDQPARFDLRPWLGGAALALLMAALGVLRALQSLAGWFHNQQFIFRNAKKKDAATQKNLPLRKI